MELYFHVWILCIFLIPFVTTQSTTVSTSTASVTETVETVASTAPSTAESTQTTQGPPAPAPSPTADDDDHPRLVEYAPYDGWYNNFAHPEWGGAETTMIRNVPTAYEDGSYEPAGAHRRNPMELSLNIFNGTSGRGSYRNLTAFAIFFGQQVVEEIVDAQRQGCPVEFFNLPIPENHQYYDSSKPENVMPFIRARYNQATGLSPNNPRQILNEISSFIDGTIMYGPNKAWLDVNREFAGGRLVADEVTGPYEGTFPANNTKRLPFANPPEPRGHRLLPISRFNRLGNPRGNENPFLLSMGILWFRYHNYWADRLHVEHPSWSDEQLFLEARKIVIAVHQKIVVYDWLPDWASSNNRVPFKLDQYRRYDPTVHPGIAHVFQVAGMRFGHTQVTPGGYRRNTQCAFRRGTSRTQEEGKMAVRTCNSYWNSQEALYESDLDELVLGLSSQLSEREDNTITPDLKGDLFGPLEFSRRDLMAINIQRGRDIGIADYNTVRKFYGLARLDDFDDIIANKELLQDGTGDPGLLDRVRQLHNNSTDDMDLWVGGILETNGGPGELFQAILKDQFTRIRDGDRFWFENRDNGLFTDEELSMIRSITIKDVIVNTTKINPNEIQDNPFLVDWNDPFWTRNPNCIQPVQLDANNETHLAPCTDRETFDYFSGSEVSYALSFTFLLASFFVFVGVLMWLARAHKRKTEEMRTRLREKYTKEGPSASGINYQALEWQGSKDRWREITIKLDKKSNHLLIKDTSGRALRTVDFGYMAQQGKSLESYLSADNKMRLMVIKLPREYDLIFKFEDSQKRALFRDALDSFLKGQMTMDAPKALSEKGVLAMAVTKEDRKKQLDNFFRAVFAHVAKDDDDWDSLGMPTEVIRQVLHSELTKHEFAEALGLRSTDTFVESMFNMIDQDNSGTVSFREFVDLIVIFYKGSADDKMRLLFNMYDVDNDQTLSREEFKNMLKSLVELSNTSLEDSKINDLISSMCNNAGVDSKRDMTFKDFARVLENYESELNYASLEISLDGLKMPKNVSRENAPMRARKTLYKHYSIDKDRTKRFSTFLPSEIKTIQKKAPEGAFQKKMHEIKRYIETYKLHIFWCVLYTFVSLGIFVERAYYYSVEREHAGLRRIAGDGVTVTRGAASGMMFTYSCLLVTMSRNTITWLRETFLKRYVPFDAAVSMHKFIALQAAVYTVCHIVGHMINFYHIATQRAPDLNCYFRNYFHATNVLPKFHYWCFETLTGFTGVLLTINFFMIYVFAVQYARRHTFRAFWITHMSYVIFFMLMLIHGAGRLVQPGFMHYFLLGPAVLFTVDQLISISRKKTEISILKAELLPSDVTRLVFKKPYNFDYRSGQWVRIACTAQGKNEYHPFTLSSAPHEDTLSLHIRAVGPWTMNLRRTYNPDNFKDQVWPKIFLDGPYGEGHQDWYRFEVAVLVGGGIGVTPFASILKDIAHKSKSGIKIACKKVYFLWVTRTQKHFEWMTDIIRGVEESDRSGLVAVHIFITQFKQKFDIRTTMLYICEKYFQKISQRSLFTGLQSITHFGRPDFESFFDMLSAEHQDTNVFGVFSCGPAPMTHNVERACKDINNKTKNVLFVHHFENF